MKINKQLFEDILSSKLKGTFVLRNGSMCSGDQLVRNDNWLAERCPYRVRHRVYKSNGAFSLFAVEDSWDIVDFIPDTNELTIEIPNGKIVDWDESKKQNKIVLKDKQLTYEDVCKKLFKNKRVFYTTSNGDIFDIPYSEIDDCTWHKNNAVSAHQLECILAKNKLATVAVYLNDGWERDCYNRDFGYFICKLPKDIEIVQCDNYKFSNNVIFKSKDLARKAIEILGEETIKLALEPLGI